MIKRILLIIFSFRIIFLIKNYLLLKQNNVSFKKRPKITGLLYVNSKGKIILGEGIRINSGKDVNVIGGDFRTNIQVSENATLRIGNNVGISNSTFICAQSITIEDNVLIGGSCKIYDTDFHSINFHERITAFKKIIPDSGAKTAPVIIREGVWLGGHCLVLKGVTINKNAIIGAGSVITKDIPANEIWAGNPARFIRKIDKK